jgi:[protein-PII] uridylyltransferase
VLSGPGGRHVTATVLAQLNNARDELSADTRRGRAGRAALERFADHYDALLQDLCARAAQPSCDAAIFALGGYGRRHLCLHSDLDLLALFDGPIGAREQEFLRGVMHPLWDLGIAVGHQVREVHEIGRLDVDDPTFALALADARLVWGQCALAGVVAAAAGTAAARAFVVEALQRLIDERYASFNDTLYQLEPNVKDAPGALRDLTALATIARLTDPALLQQAPTDRAALDEAEEFLLRIRSILHVEGRRNQNALTHEMQERVARTLGYPGSTPRQQVERLMGDYFRHARSVARAIAWTRQMAPAPVGANLVQSRDGIRFVDWEQARVRPETWLQVFATAIDTGAPVASETLTFFQQQGSGHAAGDFFPVREDREALLAFLKPRAGLYARLSELHDCGLLGQMFPEFARITCRVVRDFYHKYTVDEHTLLTIRNLERLAIGASPGRERFASLLTDLAAPELLVLSLLFHDVGKWKDDDHAVESVRLAREMLARLQLPAGACAIVEFLIQNHLRMSVVAFRRDTEDPEIVRQFAELVGTEEQLKMLCLLTVADIAAVSPETMTPWRSELLWRLYVDTYNHLTLRYGDELIDRSQRGLSDLLAQRPPQLSEVEIARFVEGLPRRYLRLFSPETIYRHVELSRDIQSEHVHATLEPRGAVWEVTVVTLDKPYLFSNICGVLSSFGMDILRGHAMTNLNGVVLDTFQFTDRERFLELNRDGRADVVRWLEEVVAGRRDIGERLRAREDSVLNRRKSGVPRFAPVIHSDNESSERYTIFDIITNNAVGLLHRVSRVISHHECDVDLVLIATEGEKAIDVFHITKGGAKLSEPARLELSAALTHRLESDDEAG